MKLWWTTINDAATGRTTGPMLTVEDSAGQKWDPRLRGGLLVLLPGFPPPKDPMRLDRESAGHLADLLKHFEETGEIPRPSSGATPSDAS